ncbi:hypothetical protein [Parathalassolituus penaei]|uniref:Uncharacterized protein n=1 Tax=Parathalassolituus penaei TaxID=2997323 RepID=A0A9X3IU69_9GAMM|nr:hypothetical protein [Parathalassolituus penaei]MCY0966654.1 hypothetical protein [Parathalassolituus penaei]
MNQDWDDVRFVIALLLVALGGWLLVDQYLNGFGFWKIVGMVVCGYLADRVRPEAGNGRRLLDAVLDIANFPWEVLVWLFKGAGRLFVSVADLF